MPARPPTHVIGDRATNAVASLLTDFGHAVERVVSDYGEDLLVQTAHAGMMDATRLWIQVKGTTSVDLRKKSALARSFPVDHVLRWIRSADTVVIVLWDVTNGRGWYAYPQQVNEVRALSQKHVTLRFDLDHEFDIEAVKVITWEARLEHYASLIRRYDDRERMEEVGEEPGDGDGDDGDDEFDVDNLPTRALRRLVAFDLFRLAGAVHVDPTDRSVDVRVLREAFRDELVQRLPERAGTAVDKERIDEWLLSAALLTSVRVLTESTGADGVSSLSLLRTCTEFVTAVCFAQEIGDLVLAGYEP